MRYAVIILGLLGIIALPIWFGQTAEQQRTLERRRARLDREVVGTVERTAYNRDDFSVAYSYTPPESRGGPLSTTQPVDPATYAALRPGGPVTVRYSSADPTLSDIKGSRYDQTLQQRGRDHLSLLAVCAVMVLAYTGHLLAVWKGVLRLPERRLRGGVSVAVGLGTLLVALPSSALGKAAIS
ncbi:MAG TPA: DUF3592 domain-containing protein [Roseiflexaceae bacterium]|nr:DUF3592 domain-containing protein [Roseiflexaceae bacterium]